MIAILYTKTTFSNHQETQQNQQKSVENVFAKDPGQLRKENWQQTKGPLAFVKTSSRLKMVANLSEDGNHTTIHQYFCPARLEPHYKIIFVTLRHHQAQML